MVRFVVPPGENLNDACNTAVGMAVSANETVLFSFRGIVLYVLPGTTVELLVATYQSEVTRNNAFDPAKELDAAVGAVMACTATSKTLIPALHNLLSVWYATDGEFDKDGVIRHLNHLGFGGLDPSSARQRSCHTREATGRWLVSQVIECLRLGYVIAVDIDRAFAHWYRAED